MKKLMVAASAALCAAVALADIESANIVGYTTTPVQGTDANGKTLWYLGGFQFKGVTETADRIKLGDAIKLNGISAFSGKWRDNGKAPQIQIYNGTGYDLYYWFAAGTEGLNETLTKDSWVDRSKNIADDVYFKLGQSFWFNAKGLGTETGSITVAGAVKTEGTATVELNGDSMQMAANPFPMDVSVNSVGCTLTPFSGKWRDNGKAPQIQVFNGVGYDIYYWFKAGTEGLGETLEKDSWVNKSKMIADEDTIPAGKGFWFMNKNEEVGTLTFNFSQAK